MTIRPAHALLGIAFVACALDETDHGNTAYTSLASMDDGSGTGSAATSSSEATGSSSGGAAASTEVASSEVSSAESSTADGTDATSESTGGAGVCDGIEGEQLIPPSVCDGPAGNTSTEVPKNGLYSTSWFGCYFGEGGEIVQDPSDNCEFACGDQGLCPGQSGPECEANLRWFAADADRYGCGGRVRVTNCANGSAVVLVTLDRGPHCDVESDCATPVLDMSHDAMVHLFDGAEHGGCDHATVVVEAVDAATPLGPV